jgi:hypothetical protein
LKRTAKELGIAIVGGTLLVGSFLVAGAVARVVLGEDGHPSTATMIDIVGLFPGLWLLEKFTPAALRDSSSFWLSIPPSIASYALPLLGLRLFWLALKPNRPGSKNR